MKLRLPNKLITALLSAAAPALFSTLSTGTLGAAAVAVSGQQALAGWDETDTNLYFLDPSEKPAEGDWNLDFSGHTTVSLTEKGGTDAARRAQLGTVTVDNNATLNLISNEGHGEYSNQNFTDLRINTLSFGEGGSGNLSVASWNTATVSSLVGSLNTITVGANGKLIFGSGLASAALLEKLNGTAGTVQLGDGSATTTITLGRDKQYTASHIIVADKTTLQSGWHSNQGASAIAKNVEVTAGGTLQLTENDALGWGSSCTQSITLAGESESHLATMALGGRQTQTTNITLKGHSRVTSTTSAQTAYANAGGFDTYGDLTTTGLFTVSGVDNIISANIYLRSKAKITVDTNGSLEISGYTGYRSNSSNDTMNGLLTKYGNGVLTFSGNGNLFEKFTSGAVAATQGGYTNAAGSTIFTGSDNVMGNLEVSAGSVSVQGAAASIQVNNDFTLADGAAVSAENGGTLIINSTNAAAAKNMLIKTTGNGNITLQQNASLADGENTQATGTLTIQGTAESQKTLSVTWQGTGGVSSFSKYALDNAKLIFLNSGATRTITLEDLSIAGESTLGTVADRTCWNGIFELNKMTGEAGSLLKLSAGSAVSWATTYHFNGADGSDFKGDVQLKIDSTSDADRRLLMDIKSGAATQLQNSVITLESTNSTTKRIVGLGIDTEATIRGLQSGEYGTHYLFSGAATNSLNDQPSSGNTVHTLTVGHGAGEDDIYTFRGNLLANLNLVKEGNGTQIFNGNLSDFNGSVTINGGTLGFGNGSNGQLTFSRNVSGAGTLLFSEGSIKYNGTASNTGGVVIDGGATVELVNGGEESKLRGTVTVKAGSTLKLSAGDATGWNKDREQRISQLLLDGGTLTVANNGNNSNQTFAGIGGANASITLKQGTINRTEDARDKGNIDLFTTTSKISVLAADGATKSAPTESTIGVNLTLRRNDWTEFFVDENAKLNVTESIRISDDISGRSSYDNKLHKTGAGTMSVAGNLDAKDIKLSGGDLIIGGNVGKSNRFVTLTYTGGNGNLELSGSASYLNLIDLSNSSTAMGTLLLKKGSETTVNDIWIREEANTQLRIEGGATLRTDNAVLTVKGTKTGLMHTQSGQQHYSTDSNNVKLTNVFLEALQNKTVNNLMENGGLKVNTAGITLTEKNGSNTSFDGVEANLGIIDLLNKSSVSVADLTVTGTAEHRAEVGVYTGETKAAANEGHISVSGTLTANEHATLKADLTMKAGSTINISGNKGLTMGSSVTLEQGAKKINLGSDIISGLNSLASNLAIGGSVTLFSGVDAFYIGDTAYDVDTTYHAGDYFNLAGVERPWDFVIKYEANAADDGGTVSLYMETPEPATATLSLLALAALAAKRKRK